MGHAFCIQQLTAVSCEIQVAEAMHACRACSILVVEMRNGWC